MRWCLPRDDKRLGQGAAGVGHGGSSANRHGRRGGGGGLGVRQRGLVCVRASLGELTAHCLGEFLGAETELLFSISLVLAILLRFIERASSAWIEWRCGTGGSRSLVSCSWSVHPAGGLHSDY